MNLRAAARPRIPSKAARTSRRPLGVAGKPLLHPARERARAERAQRLAEDDRAKLVRLADDPVSLCRELSLSDEEGRPRGLAPGLDASERGAGFLSCVRGQAGPLTKLPGQLSGMHVQIVPSVLSLRGRPLELLSGRRGLPDESFGDREPVPRSNLESLGFLGVLGVGPSNGLVGFGKRAACRTGLVLCAPELPREAVPLRRKACSECLELRRLGSDGAQLRRQPVELGESGAELLVGALELAQDLEDAFGHYDGVTR